MVVEDEQITAVIHRRRAVHRNDLPAEGLTFPVGIGRKERQRTAPHGRGAHQRENLRPRQSTRHHTQLGICTIHAKRCITAMDRQILQLHGPLSGDTGLKQRTVELPIARKQVDAHENLPHQIVDERRMYAVSAEITRAYQTVAQLCNPSGNPAADMSDDLHGRYFLSMPARRPVEKAIWRLYPPVLASRSSTSPAK